ncbi:MAG TPA: DUF929 family protein [Dehalococcoidia bacterium]|nr:DUF929 family protein [Dehalococcoidia bacterium]
MATQRSRRGPTPPRAGWSGASRVRPRQAAAVRPPTPFVQRYKGWLLLAAVGLLAIAGIVIFAIKFGPSNSGKEQAAGNAPADPAVVAALAGIPQRVYDAVGAGSASNPPSAIAAPALTQDGKPQLLYVGAEYCPYCAAERWALIAALSRFGTFSNLHTARSSASDIYANTPTFTFYGAGYDSPYLSLSAVEQTTSRPDGRGGYTALQSLSADQQAIFNQFNRPPYVSSAGAIPFLDIGGKFVLAGATYNPGLLGGQDWSTIAAQLSNPSSKEAQAIVGSANLITAAICQSTNQQPASVCQTPGVQQAATKLGATK